MAYVIMYLTAIVLANLSVALLGPGVSVLNAFLFIGLDLTARDHLHDVWRGEGLVWKMAVLITTGSALSFLLNRDAGQIALASLLAFAAAAVVDSVAYHLLWDRPRWQRMNGSNIPSAMVDSIVFPTVAFGFPLLIPVMVGQFLAKVAGGAVWSIVLSATSRRLKAAGGAT